MTPVPNVRRLAAPERRASIVAAAMTVFSEHGYQRGTMAEVARRVGVTEPVIFQNFGSKAAVFAAVIGAASERMSAVLHERVAANGSVSGWLREMLSPDHLNRLHSRGSLGVLFADALSLTADPVIARAARRAHTVIAGTLTDLLARARQEGELAAHVDPEAGAWWLLSLLASQDFRRAALPDTDRQRIEAELGAMTLRTLSGP